MKNYATEFYRFLFSMTICMVHFLKRCDQFHLKIFGGGYLVVEYFFVLSGFLLMKKYYSNQKKLADQMPGHTALSTERVCETSFSYLKGKIARLYPEYLFAFLVILVWTIYASGNIVSTVKGGFWELFMLSGLPMAGGIYNKPAWYVCDLLIAGYAIMFFVTKNRKLFTHIIAPFGIILVYGYLAANFGELSVINTVIYFLPGGVLRAFGDMLVGCLAYEAYLRISPLCKGRWKIAGTLLELLLYGAIFKIMFGNAKDLDDFVFVILVGAAIMLTFTGNSLLTRFLNNKVSLLCGKISYAIYLNHWVIIQIFKKFPVFYEKPFAQQFLLYLFIVVIYSIITYRLVLLIQRKIKLFGTTQSLKNGI